MATLEPAKAAKLQAFLTALPDRQALKLLSACEAAEQTGKSPLPIELVRTALSARTDIAIHRAFGAAMPLVTSAGGPKRPGRIARASLDALALLAAQIAPKTYSDLAAGAPPINAHREILGRALRGALRHDDGAESRFRSRLGGERGYDDACDVSALLCAEPELSDGLAEFPDRIEDLDDALVRKLRDLYDVLVTKDRSAPLLLVFLVLERLEKRAQILRLLKKLVGQEDDLMATQTDISAIGDALLDDAEAAVQSMAVAPHMAPDGPGIVAALNRFASISRGMTRELGIRRDGKWGLRLKELRNRAAKNMDVLCASAAKAIDLSLPLQRVRLEGGAATMRPAVSAPPSEDGFGRGLNFAIILGGVGDHASSCAFTAEYGKAREAAERIVDAYCNGLIELLQYADDDMLPCVAPWCALAGRFVAGLFDERAADVFRRRAAAATAARHRAAVA